ncbi:MAG TPA: PadR family transcriptional regulator [Actinoplanes sp.]|jgi:DNA-binding PadR family transcriptional regulator|nr:PadR family transcriptional regulator [Actinoplanes sp.]
MAKRRKVANLLALPLLALLVPGRPMHPYEMATLLRRTGKEQAMEIKWGSLYTVVQNLEKHGYIAATETGRSGRRPERTRYAITDAGRAELKDWLRELVGDPEEEHPRFEAALSVVGVLPPDEVAALLEQRLQVLDTEIEAQRAALARVATEVPRLFLIESEYALALRSADAAWTRSLLAELAAGSLPGMAEWRQWHQTGGTPPEWTRLMEETGMAD